MIHFNRDRVFGALRVDSDSEASVCILASASPRLAETVTSRRGECNCGNYQLISGKSTGGRVGGLNSGSRRRSGKLRDDQLHRLRFEEVRHALGARAFADRIKALQPHRAGLSVRVSDDDAYAFRVVRDEGANTIAYGLAEALSEVSPQQFVPLVPTDPHFGGTRYWFRCPRPSCGRRCSVLYREQRSNARAFACRQCIRFRYRTQVLGEADLIATRIEKLLIRCELQPDGTVRRRKGMHHRTFRMLSARLDSQAARWKATSPLSRHVDRSLAELERQIAASQSTGGAEATRKPLNQRETCTSS
jgi:hypothetical protein